jgi:hypothetical protein
MKLNLTPTLNDKKGHAHTLLRSLNLKGSGLINSLNRRKYGTDTPTLEQRYALAEKYHTLNPQINLNQLKAIALRHHLIDLGNAYPQHREALRVLLDEQPNEVKVKSGVIL